MKYSDANPQSLKKLAGFFKVKKGNQGTKKTNFFVLLLLALFSLLQSTVDAPNEGAYEAYGESAIHATRKTCKAIVKLAEAAHLGKCKDDYKKGTTIDTYLSKCKIFFLPNHFLIRKLALTNPGLEFNDLEEYEVGRNRQFKVVSVFRLGISASFYCKRGHRACELAMADIPDEPGHRVKLDSCRRQWPEWSHFVIRMASKTVFLQETGYQTSLLFDPVFVLKSMPNMGKSKTWTLKRMYFENYQLKIETEPREIGAGEIEPGHEFSVELNEERYIPYAYLKAIADTYQAMGIKNDLDFMPINFEGTEAWAVAAAERPKTLTPPSPKAMKRVRETLPLPSPIAAKRLKISAAMEDVTADSDACAAVLNFLVAADLRKCEQEFMAGAGISLFENEFCTCKVFFGVTKEFIKLLSQGEWHSLNLLEVYSVEKTEEFNVVTVETKDEESASFYCSTSSKICMSLTAALPNTKGSLKCPKWQKWFIGKDSGTIFLFKNKPDETKSLLVDPLATLKYIMPNMQKSNPWSPEAVEYKALYNQLIIKPKSGQAFSVKLGSADYIRSYIPAYVPSPYLEAFALTFGEMKVTGELDYIPAGRKLIPETKPKGGQQLETAYKPTM